jgi:CheY-like chemotaxis protein
MGKRVLVVDDAEDMRLLIRRILSAEGYDVDVAATLAEARARNPGDYDAVVVDARLGHERGTDLVEDLRSVDPAAVRRCLVITGGAPGALPADVAVLTKPFQPAQLAAAVQALTRPPASPLPDRAPGAVSAGATGAAAYVPEEGHQPAAGRPAAWRLLDVSRRRRARERRAVADFLHDGPIQELAATALELQSMRRSLPPGQAQAVDAVVRRLDAAAAGLRWLIDEEWRLAQSLSGLALSELTTALQQRTAWLLTVPLEVDVGRAMKLRPDELPAVVDVAELMLLAMVPEEMTARARLVVEAGEPAIWMRLTVWPDGQDQMTADPAPAHPALDMLAAALAASARFEPGAGQWTATLTLRRQGW